MAGVTFGNTFHVTARVELKLTRDAPFLIGTERFGDRVISSERKNGAVFLSDA